MLSDHVMLQIFGMSELFATYRTNKVLAFPNMFEVLAISLTVDLAFMAIQEIFLFERLMALCTLEGFCYWHCLLFTLRLRRLYLVNFLVTLI